MTFSVLYRPSALSLSYTEATQLAELQSPILIQDKASQPHIHEGTCTCSTYIDMYMYIVHVHVCGAVSPPLMYIVRTCICTCKSL